jgi:hypothetical protein
MTDEEYSRFLTALAQKHLRYRPSQGPSPYLHDIANLHQTLETLSQASRLLKVMRDNFDLALIDNLHRYLEPLPVGETVLHMENSGVLDALDEAHDLVFGELRYSAIPKEDEEYLRRAGFDTHEIELLIMLAVHRAHVLAATEKLPSDIAYEAARKMNHLTETLSETLSPHAPDKKRRKILNGIGKMLGGAVAGAGNVLLLTGTLIAPNPATGYAAVASGGLAISSLFAGRGDLQGV